MEFLVCIQRTGNMAELLFRMKGVFYAESHICDLRL